MPLGRAPSPTRARPLLLKPQYDERRCDQCCDNIKTHRWTQHLSVCRGSAHPQPPPQPAQPAPVVAAANVAAEPEVVEPSTSEPVASSSADPVQAVRRPPLPPPPPPPPPPPWAPPTALSGGGRGLARCGPSEQQLFQFRMRALLEQHKRRPPGSFVCQRDLQFLTVIVREQLSAAAVGTLLQAEHRVRRAPQPGTPKPFTHSSA